MEKVTAVDLIGRTIMDVVCTHPDADRHPYISSYLLQLDNRGLIVLHSGSIHGCDALEVDGVNFYSHRLAERLRSRSILAAVCCRSTAYDQTFLIIEGPLRLANCTIATDRMLFLRDSFDEAYEQQVEYWDYFSGAPVDYLGNTRDGASRTPSRVWWN